MKNLFIVSFLFCSIICKGQKNPLYITKGIKITSDSPTVIKKDTVEVILLVCDTSNHAQIPITYWFKGYAERTLVYGSIPCPNENGGLRYLINCMGWNPVSETYLDADKQPLNKNIIVWLSK